MNPVRALSCWAIAVGAFGIFAACSGDDFESSTGGAAGAGLDGGAGTSGGSAGTGAGGGGAGGGGTAGAAGTGGGGAAGSAGVAGGGGAPACSDGACAVDEYCHGDGSCRKCTDTSELAFDKPEPLAQPNAKHTTDLLAPRPASPNKALVYVVTGSFGERKLWYTEDFGLNEGGAFPAPFDIDGPEEYPLLSPPMTEGLIGGYMLFFDRAGSPLRAVFASKYDATADDFLPPEILPPPINNPAGADYSFALAQQAKRAWWMSTRDGAFNPKLFTANVAGGQTPVPVAVPLVDPNNCAVTAYETAPWVSSDGTLLLFHSVETVPGCAKGDARDMFAVSLSASGQAQPGTAKPIHLNLESVDDAYPAMSFDMCWLYFSSKRNAAQKLELWRARRL